MTESSTRYRVIDGRNRSGLFSVMTVVLENLIVAPKDVRYQVFLDSTYLYYDASWGNNVWEYYFGQIACDRPLDAILRDPNTERGWLFDRGLLLDGSNKSESYLWAVRQAAFLFRTKIGFSEKMLDEISLVEREVLEPLGNTVGIHRRATDFNHTARMPISAFFEAADPYVELGWSVFLATDSNYTLGAFRSRYGRKRLKYLRIPRSWSKRSLHLSRRKIQSAASYGRDAVLDAYCLSRSDHLIRTRSNVTTFSLILQPDLPVTELDVHLQYS